jgi:hypothetical protein
MMINKRKAGYLTGRFPNMAFASFPLCGYNQPGY